MHLTHVSRPRLFLEQLCFTQTVRDAARLPADAEWLRIFREIAPGVDWEKAKEQGNPYEPPRWIGYWYSQSRYWVSDGVLRVQAPRPSLLRELFEEVRQLHYAGRLLLPFEGQGTADPSHLILHDTELWRVYVTAFEQGEAALVRQARLC